MWGWRRKAVAVLVSVGATVLPAVVDVAPVGAAGGGGSVYVPVTPCRVVDTRPGAPLAAGEQRAVQVGGSGAGFATQGGTAGGCGIPDGATAVEASVSAVSPDGGGYFRAWPTGVAAPNATFLNYSTNQSITNTGSIPLAATGTQDLAIQNFGATADYVIDVQGYFADPATLTAGVVGSVYVPVTPCRVVDTRSGAPLAPGEQRTEQVGGTGSEFATQGGAAGGCGIPDGATAVEASVSAVGPTAGGYFRAWPTGVAAPNATFLNYSAGQSVTNTGSIPLAPTGTKDLTIRNFGATAHYVIDIQGYFADPATLAAGVVGSVYLPVTPCRVVDTRPGAPLAPGEQRAVQVGGTGSGFAAQGGTAGGCGVPDGSKAVEASVSAVSPAGGGYFRAWPTGVSAPNATFLNYSAGQSVTNTGSIPLAATGTQDLAIRNFGGTADYVIDIQGYFADPATLGPPPVVTTTSLPAGTVGSAYPGTQLTASGGTGTITWAVTSGSLPAGLALSAGGVISGTPTAGASAAFTVRAQDAQGRVGSKSLSIAVPSLSVSTTSLPGGTIGAAYPATALTAANAYGAKTWSVSSGTLPAGLALSAAGAISGTPTTGGTSTFTVRVQDAGGSVATKQLAIDVSSFAITTSALPGAQQGVGYTTVLAATGGSGYSWSITVGALPAGLSLEASTGAITGTPTGTGTATFTVRVDAAGAKTASKQLSIVVGAATEWAQLDHDEGGRAWSSSETILNPANVASVHEEWSAPANSDPVIAGGLVYTAGEVPGRSGTFAPMALDVSTGDVAWYGPSLPETCTSGQTAVTATLVVVAECGSVAAYQRSAPHAQVWDTAETDPGTSTYQFVVSGTTVVSWSSDRVLAYRTSDGQRLWQILLPSGASSTNDVAVSGSSVLVAYDDRLRSLNLATGAQLWSKAGVATSALVVADGWIYTNDDFGVSRYALADGAAGWSVRSGTDIYRVVGADADTVYAWEASFGDFGLQSSTLRALRTSDGGPRWSAELTSRVQGFGIAGGLAWVAQSEIYSTGRHADLVAYGRTDGSVLRTISFDDNFYGTVAFANGHVVLQQGGSFGGTEPQTFRSFGLLPPRPTITSRIVATGRVGTAYSTPLTATGGTGTLTWSITSGTLPAGLTLSASGVLSGTPSAATASRVQVRVRDANGRSQTRSLYVQVVAAGGGTWSAEGRDQTRDGWNRGETAVSLDSAAQLGYRWKTAVPAGTEAYLPHGRQPVVLANRLVDVDEIGRLSAWDTTGSGTNRAPVWSLVAQDGSAYRSSPVESGGVLYLLDAAGNLDAVNAGTGARLWHAPVNANSEAPGLLVQGTKVLLYDDQYDLRAYNTSNGSAAWAGVAVTLDESYLYGSKVISGDGTRAYVLANCEVKAITVATGAVAWTVPVDPGVTCFGTPARNAPILADGAVFAQGVHGSVAIDTATGTVRWRAGAHGTIYGGGGAVADGVWVIGDGGGDDGTLIALDVGTGDVLWEAAGAPADAGYAIAGDLVIARGYYAIGGFSLLTGEKLWDGGQPETNPSSADPPSIAGGRIYLPTREGIKAYGPL